ncbi:hypothetical protein AruPA_11870 [Acidiphilium sp. PA]|uniref:hypothetical protein n=1 Tax=Acidiphilium sp. PA TaxID=2871705 RepID=UPI002243EF33|nr:hypothetical protein [Acidiphilium sp. PA]MCW8307738.1 hypothetical protein [Acidiphilium sp. PA]
MSDTLASAVMARPVSLTVAIGGVPVAGAERLELLQCGHFAADRFRVMLAAGATPGGAAVFSGLQGGTVTIAIGLGGGVVPGDPILTGQIDNIAVDFGAGHIVLSGRDLSARLIDAEVGQSFANHTASQIAEAFASEAGLAANVTATTTPVGQYYELAHMRTGLGMHTRHATRWDLLAGLAALERYSLSVIGTVLTFGPPAPTPPSLVMFGRDLLTLVVDRAFGLVAPPVTVTSWNPKLKQRFSTTAGPSGATAGGVTLVRPNLTQAEVNREAAARQAALAAQAVLLRASMPGELTMVPDSLFTLQGTGTEFDTSYVVRTIERSIDIREGFVQRFEALQVA